MMKKTEMPEIFFYSLFYFISYLTSFISPELSSLCLFLSVTAVIVIFYKDKGFVFPPLRILLLTGLNGGMSIASLKLSHLSDVWTVYTWISFYIFTLIFYIASSITEYLFERYRFLVLIENFLKNTPCFHFSFSNESSHKDKYRSRLLIFGIFLFLISLCSFVIESVSLGFIPFFTVNMPHAYSVFHLKGLHYITTLNVLIPAHMLLYMDMGFSEGKRGLSENLLPLFITVMSLIMSVMLVSRFQFLFSIILSVFVILLRGRKINIRTIFTLFIFITAIYVIITVHRAHSVEYLNGIFEMKEKFPIFITQPYIYIANNYENFNYLTKNLSEYSHGLKSLYPFLTLSGLKFIFPSLQKVFPLLVVKEELTTVTIIYDAYYDFGLAGVALFSLITGFFAGILENVRNKHNNPGCPIIYAQFSFYMLFSFFTTWFSNPSVWFYFFVSLLGLCFTDLSDQKAHS